MEVLKKACLLTATPPRKLTVKAMQDDFEYRMAQKCTQRLLKEGLISEDEYNKIKALNIKTFSPFMSELIA